MNFNTRWKLTMGVGIPDAYFGVLPEGSGAEHQLGWLQVDIRRALTTVHGLSNEEQLTGRLGKFDEWRGRVR